MGNVKSSKLVTVTVSLLVLLASGVWFSWLGLNRLIARDEGFYVYAIKLVSNGQLPYLDFFYPQMPLLPYLYAPFLMVFGESWDVVRLVTALLNVGTGWMLFVLIARHTNLFFGLFGVVLFSTSNFVFPWFSTAQSYSLAGFLLFLSFYILDGDSKEERSLLRLFLAGVVLALAVNVRLYLIVLAPLFLFAVLYRGRARGLAATIFIGGFILPFLPHLYFIIADSSAYLYNNLGYHQARSGQGWFDGLEHKSKILSILLGLEPTQKYDGVGFAVLIYLWLAASWFCIRGIPGLRLSWFIVAALFVVSFIPTPNYVQYFCLLVPFLVVVACLALFQIYQSSVNYLSGLLVSVFIFGIASLYLKDLPADIERHTRTGQGVIGIGSPQVAASWNLDRVREVAEAIDTFSEEGQTVHALWPGYLLESSATSAPGLENHFSMRAGDLVEEERRSRYRVISHRDLAESIRRGEVQLLVSWSRMLPREHRRALNQSGYERFHQIGDIWFYRQAESE